MTRKKAESAEEEGRELSPDEYFQVDGRCPACNGPIYVVAMWPTTGGDPPQPVFFHDKACPARNGRIFAWDMDKFVDETINRR